MYLKTSELEKHSISAPHWLKRLGLAGFAFFFLKGMLWILLPWLAHSALF